MQRLDNIITMNGTDVIATQAEHWVDRSTVYRQSPSHGLRTRNIPNKTPTHLSAVVHP